ncbi:hypothetical protein [Metamycoplasma gateae]|uniref:DUF31 domain-containing protein n=1 Tax=Metamycoplasma gateae TaxID=35769 RepID=A0ABZ2AGL6_9BACT|nr:hypothetical protein V2E26_02460 [Metamycoplasma gateae]
MKKKQEIQQNETERVRELDWTKIFSNQIETLYKPLMNKKDESLEKVYKKYVYNGNEEKIRVVNDNFDKVEELKNEILQNKKNNKISARKFANGLIIFFIFLIIGLFFISFLIKNSKIIKKFKTFEGIKLDEINKKISENKPIIQTIFNQFSILEWKNKVLEQMDIFSVDGIDYKDFEHHFKDKEFYGFNSIQKYSIRNSYFYDLLYTKEYWTTVTTRGVGYKSVRTKDGWTTVPVYAYHHEPTPFMDNYHSINIPTNYKESLQFIQNEDTFNEKQYDKRLKKGEFLLENKNFYKYYNFSYNDKIGYIDFFKVNTQENFVKYAEFFKDLYSSYRLSKVNKNIITARKMNREIYNNKLAYLNWHNWVGQVVNLNQAITIENIYDVLANIISSALQHVFISITLLYLNTNIASENYADDDRYLSDYSFNAEEKLKQIKLNSNSTFTLMDVINKIISSNKFQLKTHTVDKDTSIMYNYFIEDNKFRTGGYALQFAMSSYWKQSLIDSVYTEGIIVDVPYDKFNFFTEHKWAFYFPFEISYDDHDFISYNDNLFENSFSLNMTAQATRLNGLSYNATLVKDEDKLQYFADILNKIKQTEINKLDNKVLIDRSGIIVFINNDLSNEEVDNIFKIFRNSNIL